MKGVKIIWKSNNRDKSVGYLRVSQRFPNLKKTKITSLGLPPIKRSYFDEKSQRVKNSFKDHELYNSEIEKTLEKLRVKKKMIYVKEDKKSFLKFVETFVFPNQISIGTKQKYQYILKLVKEFNKYRCNSDDVLFSEIDVEFIYEWKSWLRNIKKFPENGVSYKTKYFAALVNKAIKTQEYTFISNPFKVISNPITTNPVDYLTEEELERLTNTELYEIIRSKNDFGKKKNNKSKYNKKNNLSIETIRDIFLYQVFQHGLRISDVMTLRWSNFISSNDDLRYLKRMIKTKHTINSLVYFPSIYILSKHIPKDIMTDEDKENIEFYQDFYDLRREINIENHQTEPKKKKYNVFIENGDRLPIINQCKEGDYYKISIDDVENSINRLKNRLRSKYSPNRKKNINIARDDIKIKNEIKSNEDLIYLNQLLEHVKGLNDNQESNEMLIDYHSKYYKLVKEVILKLKSNKNYKNRFVFPLLNDIDFENIKNETGFDNMSAHQYLKLQGRRSYFNKILKNIGEQCGIEDLTSHKSRHTYTSLLIKNNKDINLYDLMQSLGHKHITTTQSYISNFINNRIDDFGKDFADRFAKL